MKSTAPDSSVDWAKEPDRLKLSQAKALLKTDPDEALIQLSELADRGSLMSMLYIGWAYNKGEGFALDSGQAEKWFLRAVDGGSILGSFYLATLYKKDGRNREAIDAFEIGASKGFAPSMYRMGVMFRNGEGRKVDIDAARSVWKLAAELGHVYAKRNLSLMYMTGRYGIVNCFLGIIMIVMAPIELFRVYVRDPQSDLIR